MDWFPEPYEDETIYSILARLWVYLGQPNNSALLRAIFGRRHWVAMTQLPCQLDAFKASCGLTDADIDRLIDDHTLLPFYTAFATETVREQARAQMRGSTNGLQFTLGISTSPVPAPTHLRFCQSCMAEMIRAEGEAWWRRIHQLPGITVCAIHADPLLDSIVDLRRGNRHVLVPANERSCVRRGQGVDFCAANPGAMERWSDLARAAGGLLTHPPPAGKPAELYERLQRSLANVGASRGTRHIQFTRLDEIVRTHWRGALTGRPGLDLDQDRDTPWLLDHVRNRRKQAHPLRHLVVNLAIAEAPLVDQPFGGGPWPCLNPIGGHFQVLVVDQFRQVRDRGKLHGHFSCSCGYSYSRTRQLNGQVGVPRFRRFGPSLRPYLMKAIRAGKPLRAIAREVLLDPKTLIREALALGVEMPWSTKPSGRPMRPEITG